MSDVTESKSNLQISIFELESLGLIELKYSYEVEKIVEIIKQMLFREYKSMPQIESINLNFEIFSSFFIKRVRRMNYLLTFID